MSTILEALKKSEQERKLNKLPTLSDMPAPQEVSRWPTVATWIVALCLVLLVVIFIGQRVFGDKFTSQTKTSKIVINNETVAAEINQSTTKNSDTILVNVISYSSDPLERFAMVNGKLFREGEFVTAGLKVESIKLDVVVFNQRGSRITRKP